VIFGISPGTRIGEPHRSAGRSREVHTSKFMGNNPEILKMLNACRFDEAIPAVEKTFRAAAAESPERLIDAARGIVGWRGFFKNIDQERVSETYFRSVYQLLQELAGPDSPAAMAAGENLAGILGALDQNEEAITLREKVFDSVSKRFPPDDPRYMQVRDGLVFLYRRAGHQEKVAALNRKVRLCEHLAGALQYILDQGAQIFSCGQAWTENCHIWAYFDTLLDCDGLMTGLSLDPCVQIHDHRGTHEGSERGLVCSVHHDALMGPHPSDAGPQTRTITKV
jgi:hypothetical protein